MDVCNGCAFEFGWTQQSTSVPNECKGCQMVNGKPSNYKPKPQTNADRIRAMSDEELAKWLVKKTKYQESAWSAPSYLNFLTESDDTMESAIKGTAEWLKQPADMRGEEDAV